MATFGIQALNKILSTLPLYKSEQITNDLGRGLTDRAYQALWREVGSTSGELLNKIFGGNDISGVYDTGVAADSLAEDSNMVQQTSVGKDTGAFKWVQENLTPEMFVSADSCFIAFGDPVYSSNTAGTDFSLIGVCQSLNINVGINVVSIKELRGERNLIFPLKSNPGSMTISRLLCASANLAALTHKSSGWVYDTQLSSTKKLFGVLIAFMTPGRTRDIAAIYAERCAIRNMTTSITANNFALTESMDIIFDRLKDGVQVTDNELANVLGSTSYTRTDPITGQVTSYDANTGVTTLYDPKTGITSYDAEVKYV